MTFDPNRIGPAAVAATVPGQTTQYGLAYDLATGQWINSTQFNNFVRDTVSQNYKAAADDPALKPLHDSEWAQAQQYENGDFNTTGDKGSSWFGKISHNVGAAVKGVASNPLTGIADFAPTLLTGHTESAQHLDSPPSYADYSKAGGLLTQDEFKSLSGDTQLYIYNQAKGGRNLAQAESLPGIHQVLGAMSLGYRGLTATAIQAGALAQPWHIERLVDTSRWAQAWRESSDESLGNALANDVLSPFASQDKLNQWRKHSSLYQLTSFGADLATAYYLDPTAIAGKGVGAASRFSRNERVLGETGGTAQATTQALQRQQITVKNPIARAIGVNRANRMFAAQDDVERLAQQTTLSQFAGMADGYSKLGQMFRGRTVDGQPLAYAIHHAANVAKDTGDRTLMDMTWRLAYADPEAFATLNKWKAEAPEALQQYAPGAQTFIDALDATKTRATQLEREYADLNEAAEKAHAERPDTFYDWSIHASLADKQADLKAAQDTLEKYEGYGSWLNSFSTPEEIAASGGAANSTPLLAQVYAPKSSFRTVAKTNLHPNGVIQRTFRDNPYGVAQTVTKLPRATWTQRANTVNMHDLNSGPVSLSRQAAQLKQLFGYEDPQALDQAITSWNRATTAAERERVVAAYEETHVMRAAAQRFSAEGTEVGEDVIRGIYNKVITEQNKFIRAMNAGQGVVYDATDASKAISLVDTDEDAGTVTLRLMDGGRHQQTITVPAEAWQEKALNEGKRPNSVTQTANYYTPINHREFYLALKRDPELLSTIDAGLTTRSKAEIMQAIDSVGDKWNSLWKPWSLLRLGWPMRVLMDENLRALAVLGPMQFLKSYGPAYMAGSYNVGLATGSAIAGLSRRLVERKFQREQFPIGDGPIAQGLQRDDDPIARSEEILSAPSIPTSLHESVDMRRRTKVAGIVTRYAGPGEAVDHPAVRMVREARRNHAPAVYDPISGAQARTGHIIPLQHTKLAPGWLDTGVIRDWYSKHADMLSKPGHRIVVDQDGNAYVGRAFRASETKRATDYLQHVSDALPDSEMWNLGTGKTYRVTTEGEMTPVVREAYRPTVTAPRGQFATTVPGKTGDLYAIKGTNGKLRIWDADAEITPELHQRLLGWLDQNRADFGLGDANLNALTHGAAWRDLITRDDSGAITAYLEREQNVGVIKHTVNGEQVHTWLDPENTLVRPLYVSGDRYHPALDWFDHPDSAEVPHLHEAQGDPVGEDLDAFDAQASSPAARVIRAILRRKEQGKGWRTLTSADGTKIRVPKAFEGAGGEMLHAQVSSEKAIDSISEGHGRATEWGRRNAIGHKVYHAPDMSDPEVLKPGTKANRTAVEYFGQWADLVNNQIRQDPIYEKMLGGWSNDKITNWLTTTPAGARVRQELMHEGRTPELWVSEQRYRLNKYLPSPILQRRLTKGRITPADLRRQVADEHLPDVFGPELDAIKKNTAIGRFFSRVMDGLWGNLGTKPIDALSRQPFAKAHYDLKMKALINSTDSKWLSNEQIAYYQKIAQKFAENRVKQHLWDLVDNTNFTDALRFIAPFWNAQQEAMVKWARIISDRPEVVGRFMAANRAAYKNFVVLDQNDEPVNYRNTGKGEIGLQSKVLGLFGYHPNDRVVMPLPGFMQKIPGMGKMLQEVGSTGIPIGSANTVLQGENPLLPGFGPLVTVPADKLLRTMDRDAGGVTHDHQMWYQWLFPIGRPQDGPTGAAALNPLSGGNYLNLLEQIMPGYAKRVQTLGSDGPGWSNTLMQVGRQKTLDAMAKGLHPGDPGWPTDSDIRKSAVWYQGLRIFSGLASPVQTEYRPQAQMLIDEYRKYQDQYGQDALDNFIRDADKIVSQLPSLKRMVGRHTYSPILDDAQEAVAMYAGSSSTSTAGIPPTDKGMAEYGHMRDLMSAYPDAGSAIIGQDAYNDAFSSDAYYIQGQVDLGDADNTKLRSFPSYRARMDAAQAQAGWYEYRQVNAAINAELQSRGLTSLQQTGASDLAALKRNFTADLRQRNTSWAADYDQENNNIYDWINEAQNGTNGNQGWVWDKRLDDRPDVQGFRQYLVIRQQVVNDLDQYRDLAGGSASLQSTGQFNTAVRNWFYGQVGKLIQSNPAFAEFYSRYLDSDTLEQGSGGFGGDNSE